MVASTNTSQPPPMSPNPGYLTRSIKSCLTNWSLYQVQTLESCLDAVKKVFTVVLEWHITLSSRFGMTRLQNCSRWISFPSYFVISCVLNKALEVLSSPITEPIKTIKIEKMRESLDKILNKEDLLGSESNPHSGALDKIKYTETTHSVMKVGNKSRVFFMKNQQNEKFTLTVDFETSFKVHVYVDNPEDLKNLSIEDLDQRLKCLSGKGTSDLSVNELNQKIEKLCSTHREGLTGVSFHDLIKKLEQIIHGDDATYRLSSFMDFSQ